MTAVYKKEPYTAYKLYLEKIVCDRCGKVLEHLGSYEFRDSTLEFKEGSGYPDGSVFIKEGWEIDDLCPECLSLLKKLLEDNGFNIKRIED